VSIFRDAITRPWRCCGDRRFLNCASAVAKSRCLRTTAAPTCGRQFRRRRSVEVSNVVLSPQQFFRWAAHHLPHLNGLVL
jgi:hypothetical protein